MSTDSAEERKRVEAESTVTESYGTTIPSEVRQALREGLEPGDKVHWIVEGGEVSVEIVRERYGVTDDVEPFDGPVWDGETAAESAWGE
jgi:bifunctional DNA-binding transcriptional regulator/antitoxin component of YhaV-PrlF toxin-antitoxin module